MTVHIEVTADRRFGTNSYLVQDEGTHDAVVIDSNLEPVHDAEREVVEQGKPLRREFGPIATQVDNVARLADGERFRAGSLEFEVLHTPGHSPGGVTLKIDGYLFTGDALFAGSVGRSDFANSDGHDLIEGIRDKLLAQPDDMIVYSGHGPATTIGRERRMNPFLAT